MLRFHCSAALTAKHALGGHPQGVAHCPLDTGRQFSTGLVNL